MTPYSGPLYPAPNTTVSELYIDPATGVARGPMEPGSQPRTVGTPVAIPASLISLDAQGKVIPQQYLIFSEGQLSLHADGRLRDDVRGIIERRRLYEARARSICVFYPGDRLRRPPVRFCDGGRLGSPSPATQRHIEQKRPRPKRGLSCSVLGRRNLDSRGCCGPTGSLSRRRADCQPMTCQNGDPLRSRS